MDFFRSLCLHCPMGTFAFSNHYSVGTPCNSSSSTTRAKMSCEECNVKFSILRRKKTCNECGSNYCGTCLKRGKGSPRCHRCCIFAVVPLDRSAVTNLKVRDLRWFLDTNKIPFQGCKEKVDLVDLVMHHAALRNATLAYPQNYERHTQRAEDTQMESRENSPVFRPVIQRPSHVPFEAVSQIENIQVHEIEDGFTFVDIEENTQEPTQVSDIFSEGTSQVAESLEEVPDVEDILPNSDDVCEKVEGTSGSILSINDITHVDQISTLTVMQLKLVLTRNFVGFKGCCEKQELQDKVRHLWLKKQEAKNVENISDENLCKICMEAAIDSVLLDCGHLVSCTECGKRLHECPICRQYVVRVVHTFKA